MEGTLDAWFVKPQRCNSVKRKYGVHVSNRDRQVVEINLHFKIRKVSFVNGKLGPRYPQVNVGFRTIMGYVCHGEPSAS